MAARLLDEDAASRVVVVEAEVPSSRKSRGANESRWPKANGLYKFEPKLLRMVVTMLIMTRRIGGVIRTGFGCRPATFV